MHKCTVKGCLMSFYSTYLRTVHTNLEWHCPGCGFSDGWLKEEHLFADRCDLCTGKHRNAALPQAPATGNVISIDFKRRERVL